MDFIREHADQMSPAQIGEKLNRTPGTIADWIKHNIDLRPSAPPPKEVVVRQTEEDAAKIGIKKELRSSLAWRNLKEEFLTEELRYFEERFAAMMTQFFEDVTPTEESQIFLAIKLEILMSRNLKAKAKAVKDAERLEEMRDDFLRRFKSATDLKESQQAHVLTIETQIQAVRAAEQSRTGEFVKLEEKHADLMKALKSTREQRIKQVETNKVSFVGVLKELQRKEVQEREGHHMELARLAADKEYDRLGRPHQYSDGNMDNPILSADTVHLGPLEEEDDG